VSFTDDFDLLLQQSSTLVATKQNKERPYNIYVK